jgi:hypothetical protein
MKIELTAKDYHKEIEALDIPSPAKGLLEGMVNSHLNRTIPPGLSNMEKQLLRSIGIDQIMLSDDKGRARLLEISVYIPDNPKTHRQFGFLRDTWTHGETRPIGSEKNTPAKIVKALRNAAEELAALSFPSTEPGKVWPRPASDALVISQNLKALADRVAALSKYAPPEKTKIVPQEKGPDISQWN